MTTPSDARRRTLVGAAVAVVALALVSTLALAAFGGFRRYRPRAYGTVTCAAPHLPGRVVRVDVDDLGGAMMAPVPMHAFLRSERASVGAGPISFVVRNAGDFAHELLVLPLAADGPGTRPTGRDGTIDESTSVGEASRSCAAGSGDGIAPGSTGWVTLDLEPGRYELVCDEPWHYAAGMFDVITVR